MPYELASAPVGDRPQGGDHAFGALILRQGAETFHFASIGILAAAYRRFARGKRQQIDVPELITVLDRFQR